MIRHLFVGRQTATLVGGAVWTASPDDENNNSLAPASVVREAWKLLPPAGGHWLQSRLAVWLSSAWVRPFVVSPAPGLRSWEEVLAWSRAECRTKVAATWREGAEIWLDRWSDQHGALALATEPAIIESLRASAHESGWRLRSIRPWWALPRLLRGDKHQSELLFAPCPDGTTWLVGDARTIVAAGAWLPAPVGSAADSMRKRLILSHPGVTVRELTWTSDWLERP